MAKQQNGKVAAAPAKIKASFSLSPKAFKRLGAACVYLDMSQSELAEKLINDSLAGYRVVNDPAKSPAQVAQVISGGGDQESNPPAEKAAA
jgi:hypothetical protein